MSARLHRPSPRHDISPREPFRRNERYEHALGRTLRRALLCAWLFIALSFAGLGLGTAQAQDDAAEPPAGAPAPVTAGEAITGSAAVTDSMGAGGDAEAYGGPESAEGGEGTEGAGNEAPDSGDDDEADDAPAGGRTNDRTDPVMSPSELWPFTVLLLGFALLLNLMLINYFTHAQQRYFETVQKFLGSGRALPDSHSVASFQVVSRGTPESEPAGSAGPVRTARVPAFTAKGPKRIPIGEQVEFEVDEEVEWSVFPANAVEFEALKAKVLKLTATEAGPLEIRARSGSVEATLPVVASAPSETGDPIDRGSQEVDGRVVDESRSTAMKLEAKGPKVVTVGKPAEFTVDREAEWSVEPADAAVFDREAGKVVALTAKKAGEFKVKVRDGEAAAELKVTANEAAEPADPVDAASRGSLPFVGAGVGTVTIAVVLVVAVVILAFRGIMSSDAVATFLGGLLGYIFGVRKSE